jgi:beta-galactosidase
MKLPLGYNESAQLDILVENMGRINYGPKLLDRKGIKGVRFGNQYHFGWDIYPLPMNDLSALKYGKAEKIKKDQPLFLRGELDIDGEPKDTFLELEGFTKGFVTVNGINIGRYFNTEGPQKTLYVPAPFLKNGKNEIVVFESDGTSELSVTFTDTPKL